MALFGKNRAIDALQGVQTHEANLAGKEATTEGILLSNIEKRQKLKELVDSLPARQKKAAVELSKAEEELESKKFENSIAEEKFAIEQETAADEDKRRDLERRKESFALEQDKKFDSIKRQAEIDKAKSETAENYADIAGNKGKVGTSALGNNQYTDGERNTFARITAKKYQAYSEQDQMAARTAEVIASMRMLLDSGDVQPGMLQDFQTKITSFAHAIAPLNDEFLDKYTKLSKQEDYAGLSAQLVTDVLKQEGRALSDSDRLWVENSNISTDMSTEGAKRRMKFIEGYLGVERFQRDLVRETKHRTGEMNTNKVEDYVKFDILDGGNIPVMGSRMNGDKIEEVTFLDYYTDMSKQYGEENLNLPLLINTWKSKYAYRKY